MRHTRKLFILTFVIGSVLLGSAWAVNNLPADIKKQEYRQMIVRTPTSHPDAGLPCATTPAAYPSFIIAEGFRKTNNLVRRAGYPERAKGQYIVIKGTVVDNECAPISGALVYISQADQFGRLPMSYEMNGDWDTRDPQYDPNFGYSGVARTNNLGEFEFVTILPGPMVGGENRAPHLNVKLHHDDFRQIETVMYFNHHPRNKTDAILTKLQPYERKLLMAEGEKLDRNNHLEGRVYTINYTLEGMNRYRKY